MTLLKKVNPSLFLYFVNSLWAYYVNFMKVFFLIFFFKSKYFLLSISVCARFSTFLLGGSLKAQESKIINISVTIRCLCMDC